MTTDETPDATSGAAREHPPHDPPHDPPHGLPHDAAWFAVIFGAHSGALYRYFRRRLPTGQGAVGPDAEDLAAEVLATAWRRRDDVPDGAELPWLYRTAGFVLANHRRKARAVPVADVPEEADAGADVEHVVVQDDEVRRALVALSPRDRRILLLHAWEGLTGDELAAVLGVSRGGADAALSRARARLRAAWDGGGAVAVARAPQETGA
ncbi:sigma-70 family RNA polymerase sigma factor [Cellulosimicrobium sp. PMB13]|uniref:RNA polymerase sigma factor n=1 Tax=Cellulosimicrobium sp. PMB13 TaxID=3120158 RepID=UPI003F4BF22B